VLRRALDSEIGRFMAIGVASTLAYGALYLGLRGAVGPGTANALALAITGVANTQANRRLTFGVRGRRDLVRHHLQGGAVFALTLALTSLALYVQQAVAPHAPRLVELAVLLAASVAATVTRFVALRGWVFARRRAAQPDAHDARERPST
jgi:putative flippase GtrA